MVGIPTMWLNPALYAVLFPLLVGAKCELGPKQTVYGQPVGVLTCTYVFKLQDSNAFPEWMRVPLKQHVDH